MGNADCAEWWGVHLLTRPADQVTLNGDVEVVSGVGGKGISRMPVRLSGGKGLGSDGAQRLADLLGEVPP